MSSWVSLQFGSKILHSPLIVLASFISQVFYILCSFTSHSLYFHSLLSPTGLPPQSAGAIAAHNRFLRTGIAQFVPLPTLNSQKLLPPLRFFIHILSHCTLSIIFRCTRWSSNHIEQRNKTKTTLLPTPTTSLYVCLYFSSIFVFKKEKEPEPK